MPHPDYPESGTCETCKWQESGNCRIAPPQSFYSTEEKLVYTWFPVISLTKDWCGEYAPKRGE